MVVKALYQWACERIDKNDAAALLCSILQTDRAGLLLLWDEQAPEKEYREKVLLRAQGMPIAYITGQKEFYSLSFAVDQSVLIPRPDTETLVELVIKNGGGKRVLDLCCGSGCIGIAAAYYADAAVTLADISPQALDIAGRNAKTHGINAELLKLDIFEDEIKGSYDIIASNPPYIESGEVEHLMLDVRGFEPLTALDGGESGLSFYPVIAQKAYNALAPGGILALEVGHTQAGAVKEILRGRYENIQTVKDLSGIERVVYAYKNL